VLQASILLVPARGMMVHVSISMTTYVDTLHPSVSTRCTIEDQLMVMNTITTISRLKKQ
jgi:hypothetical protein